MGRGLSLKKELLFKKKDYEAWLKNMMERNFKMLDLEKLQRLSFYCELLK